MGDRGEDMQHRTTGRTQVAAIRTGALMVHALPSEPLTHKNMET